MLKYQPKMKLKKLHQLIKTNDHFIEKVGQ